MPLQIAVAMPLIGQTMPKQASAEKYHAGDLKLLPFAPK
jgi:hypothetical protein